MEISSETESSGPNNFSAPSYNPPNTAQTIVDELAEIEENTIFLGVLTARRTLSLPVTVKYCVYSIIYSI